MSSIQFSIRTKIFRCQLPQTVIKVQDRQVGVLVHVRVSCIQARLVLILPGASEADQLSDPTTFISTWGESMAGIFVSPVCGYPSFLRDYDTDPQAICFLASWYLARRRSLSDGFDSQNRRATRRIRGTSPDGTFHAIVRPCMHLVQRLFELWMSTGSDSSFPFLRRMFLARACMRRYGFS